MNTTPSMQALLDAAAKAPATRLSAPDIQALLASGTLPGWRLSTDGLALECHYDFADFACAFAFMAAVAVAAERVGHHPEWSNVYKHVSVRWTTHDAHGITARDAAMAQHGQHVAQAMGGQPAAAHTGEPSHA